MRSHVRLSLVVTAVALMLAISASTAAAAPPVAEPDGLYSPLQEVFPNTLDGSQPGWALAMTEDTLVFPSTTESVVETAEAGAVYVYRKVDGHWSYEARLQSPSPQRYAGFGRAVAVDGDLLAVSAAETVGGEALAGRVYLFRRYAGGWRAVGNVTAPTPDDHDYFGDSLALRQGILVVGAANWQPLLGPGVGRAYVYKEGSTGWQHVQTLAPATDNHNSYFGRDVAFMDDGHVLVGAPHSGSDDPVGCVYVYTGSPGSYSIEETFTGSQTQTMDGFGYELSASGDSVAVMALHAETEYGQWMGEAYVFTRTNGVWSEQARIVPPAGTGTILKDAVALDGDSLVLGSWEQSTTAGIEAGRVWRFQRKAGAWALADVLERPGAAAEDWFGAAVGQAGGQIVATVPGADGEIAESGSFIVYGGYETSEDKALVVGRHSGVLANDSDPDGETLSASLLTQPAHGTLLLYTEGGFIYTPDADWHGADTFTYRAFDGSAYSDPATVTITVTPVDDPTMCSLSSTNQTIAYGRSGSVAGKLTAWGVDPLVGRTVTLQKSSTTSGFTDVATQSTVSGGYFSFAVRPSTKAYYRVRFSGAGYVTSYSGYIYVDPRASLTAPVVSRTQYLGRSYTAYGFLKPRHSSGTYAVTLLCERREGTAWVKRKTIRARVSNYSSYSRYTTSVRLPYKGTWRIKASHDDGGHAASSSGYTSVTVK